MFLFYFWASFLATHIVLFIEDNYIWRSEFLSALYIIGTLVPNARCRWWHL